MRRLNFHVLYALLALVMCALAGIALLLRRDLWRAALGAGIAGGVLEVTAEIWYLRDYWNPPTLLGFPAPEDFFYGFGTTALTVCIAPILLRKQYVQRVNAGRRRWPFVAIGLAVFHFVLLTGASPLAHSRILSIWMATLVFAFGGIIILSIREDMVKPAALTAVVMAVVAAVGYALGLNVIIDGKQYLDQVLLFKGTAWDIRVLGNVPLDEITWNFARAWCVVAAYAVMGGRRLAPLPK